jgi:glutathione S-transferase
MVKRVPARIRLYYSPGACSMAPHIVAREASIPIDLVRVHLDRQTTENTEDYREINPRGYVPALQIDGEVHTEVAALVQFLAEQAPPSSLLPPSGTLARFRVNQWLGFVSSELHKTVSPWLFSQETAASTRHAVLNKFASRLAELNARFAAQPYLTGEHFTVADAYAFTIVSWSDFLNVDLHPYPKLREFMARVAARPRVREALEAEGLVKMR